MIKITATVAWFVSVEVEVPDNATLDEKQDAILNQACGKDLGDAIIHTCSDENCID